MNKSNILFILLLVLITACITKKKSQLNSQDTIRYNKLAKPVTIDDDWDITGFPSENERDILVAAAPPPPSAPLLQPTTPLSSTSSTNSLHTGNNLTQSSTDQKGQLIYVIPDSMKVGKTYHAIVRISRSTTLITMYDGLTKISEDTIIKTSASMNVILIDASGTTFKIVPSNDKQLVDNEEYTEWIFDITPLKSAKTELRIVISRYIDGNLKQTVYKKSVVVTTTTDLIAMSFIDKYWQWLFSTLLLPFILWFYKTRLNKVNKPD